MLARVYDKCVRTWKCAATCMRAYVSLEVEGVVEAFAAEAAQVSLGLVVALDVSVQHPLVVEGLLANLQVATAPSRPLHSTSTFSRLSGLWQN